MGMYLSMTPGQRMEQQEPQCADNVLARLRERLLQNNDGLKLFQALEKMDEYRGPEDFLLAVFLPEIKPEIVAFYNDKGKQLKFLYRRDFISRLDRALLAGFNQGAALWSKLKDTADQQGLTRDQLMTQITPTLRTMFVPLFKDLKLEAYRLKEMK